MNAGDEGEEQQGCSVPLHARVEFGAVFHEDVAAEHPVQRGVLVDETYAIRERSVTRHSEYVGPFLKDIPEDACEC